MNKLYAVKNIFLILIFSAVFTYAEDILENIEQSNNDSELVLTTIEDSDVKEASDEELEYVMDVNTDGADSKYKKLKDETECSSTCTDCCKENTKGIKDLQNLIQKFISSGADKNSINNKKMKKVFTDKNGNSFTMGVDENGNKIVISPDGVKRIVQKDADGREYFLDANGNKVYLDEGLETIEDSNGVKRPVQTDAQGRKFYVDENGNKIYLDDADISDEAKKKGEKLFTDNNGNSFSVGVDENGNKFVIGPDGKKRMVLTDPDGREYFLDANGNKVHLDEGTESIIGADSKPHKLMRDKSGRQYYVDENGNKVFVDENGNIIPNSPKAGDQIFTDKNGNSFSVGVDENGNKFVVGPDGKKRMVLTDPDGRKYFLDANGNKVHLDEGTESIIGADDKPHEVLTDPDGREYYLDDNGNKIYTDGLESKILLKSGKQVDVSGSKNILTDPDGREYYLDDNGNKIYTDGKGEEFTVKYNKDGDKYIEDANGNIKPVLTDENDNEYILDENGNKIYLDDSIEFVTDDEGNLIPVNEDEDGKRFIENNDGTKTYIEAEVKKTEDPLELGYYDENGNFIRYQNGVNGEYNKDGLFELYATNSDLTLEEKESPITFIEDTISDEVKNRELVKRIKLEDAAMILSMLNKNQEDLASKRWTDGPIKEPTGLAVVQQKYKDIAAAAAKLQNGGEKEDEGVFITALCEVENTKKVISKKSLLETYCTSPQINDFILVSQLDIAMVDKVPELTGTPLFINTDLGYDVSATKYTFVKNGEIENYLVNDFTKNRNIATWVNVRRLEQWIIDSANDAFNHTQKGVDSYQEALISSETEKTTQDNADGSTEVTISGTGGEPKLADFLAPSYINIGMSIVKNGIKAFSDSQPYLYAIEGKTILKLYAYVTKE